MSRLFSLEVATTALCAAALVLGASAETVSFTEETGVFVNPAQGWTSYGNWDRVTNHVNVGCGYFRFQWQQFNPAEDVYDWKALEREIDFYAKKGLPFTFRIMTCSRNGGRKSLVPGWVWAKGAKYKPYPGAKYNWGEGGGRQEETTEMWCPVWNDEVFLAAHDKFIKALAEKYDGDPRILYIDIGSYGNWGEWHCWRLGKDGVSNRDYGADDETKWRIMRMYIERFRKTPLIAMTDDVPTLVRLFKGSEGSPPAGLRRDGVGLPGLFKRWGKGDSPYNAVDGMDDVWKTKPIAFEWLQSLSRLIKPGDKAFERGKKMDDIGFAVRWMLDRHVSTIDTVPFMPWQLDEYPEKKKDVRALDLYAGARLVPVSAEVERAANGSVSVSLKGVNKGVAPIYAPYRLSLCVKSAGWQRDFDTDLSACLPGPFVFKGTFDKIPAGTLSIRIRHVAGIWRDFRFAAKELDAEGSLVLRSCPDAWYVCGGTDSFRSFLGRLASGAPIRAYDNPAAIPYEAATNSVIFLLPDYKAGKRAIPEPDADVARRIKAAQARGNRFWIECCFSERNIAPDVNIGGTETYGRRPVNLHQEYVEWNGTVLQARRSYYLPAGIRGSNKRNVIKGEVFVSDCIGVHKVHRPGTHRLPATVVSRNGAVVAALMNFTQMDPLFMRPYRRWCAFYAAQFGRLTGIDAATVERAFGETWPDPISIANGADAGVALRRALDWHFKSGILFSPDGAKGMRETVASDDFGYRSALRTDSHLLTGALFAAAGRKMNRPEWVALGRNLVDFMLANGVQTAEGFYTWFAQREGIHGDTVYSSDMGRDALAMINMYKSTGDEKYLASARKAADAFLLWMDGSGLNSGSFKNARSGGWRSRYVTDNPVFYGEMVCFLLQMGEKKYTDAALRTLDKISARFPAVKPFHFSDNFTYSRYLVMLASAQFMTDRDYSRQINDMLDFCARNMHPAGGISELPIRLDDDDEAGVGIGDGSDHIADMMYCNNFVLNATSILVKLPEGKRRGVDIAKARSVYDSVRRFFLRTQIVSEDKRLDGAWMRAFDMDIGEYYGLDKDRGWGAYCIQSGWVMGFVPLVLLYEDEVSSFFYR